MTLTLSRSISSCALVLAPAGLPPVSADQQIDLAAGERVALLLQKRGDALLHLDAALRQRAGLDGQQADLERRALGVHGRHPEVAALAPVASMPLSTVLRLTVMAFHSLVVVSLPVAGRICPWCLMHSP